MRRSVLVFILALKFYASCLVRALVITRRNKQQKIVKRGYCHEVQLCLKCKTEEPLLLIKFRDKTQNTINRRTRILHVHNKHDVEILGKIKRLSCIKA